MAIKKDKSSGVEYYTPELVHKLSDVKIPDSELATESDYGFKIGEVHHAKLDHSIIERVAHGIYSGSPAGIRELYNNEAKACRWTAKNYPESKPEIVITIKPEERWLEIKGIDSRGMTFAHFDKVLKYLGRSGNTDDGEEIGQFGMGFASYTTIFESMVLNISSREDPNQHFAFLCDGGLGFKGIQHDDSLETYGVSIAGVYRDKDDKEDPVDVDKLIDRVHECARYSQVKTTIYLESDTYGHSAGRTTCTQYKDGYEYIMRLMADDIENRSHLQDTAYFRSIKIDNDDYTFSGFIRAYSTTHGSINRYHLSTDDNVITLVGTPVIATLPYEVTQAVSGYHLNIKNERKYMPKADRDNMKEGGMAQLGEILKEDLADEFECYKLKDVEDYNSRPSKTPYCRDIWGMINHILTDDTTESIVSTLDRNYPTAPDKSLYKMAEMLELRDREIAKGIDYKVVALKGLRGDLMARLNQVFKGEGKVVKYFRLPTRDTDEEKEARRDTLRQLGVVMGEEYARENSLRVKRIKGQSRSSGDVADAPIRLYNSNSYHEQDLWGLPRWKKFYSTTISSVNANVHDMMVRIKKDDWLTAESTLGRTDWLLIKDRKGFNKKIKTMQQVFKELEDTKFEVNTKVMTLKELYDKQLKDKRTTNKPQVIYCEYNAMLQDERKEGRYTLKELGLDEDQYYLISPADKCTNVPRLKDLLDWYDKSHKVGVDGGGYETVLNYQGIDNESVSKLLKKELLIEDEDNISGDKLEKCSALLRVKRKCDEIKSKSGRDLYGILRDSIIYTSDDNHDKMLMYADKVIERLNK